MKCNVCGRQTQNEEANFCEYCGGSFREHMQNSINMPPQNQGIPYPGGPMNNMGPMPGHGMPNTPYIVQNEKPTSFLNWLGTYGLLFIPLAGWLAFLVLLFIWAFSDNTPTSKKNWARATLILVGILIVVFIIYIIAIMNTPMYQDIYQQMMNGTFDSESYYNDILSN